jgi:hypothetical protein
MSVCKAVVCFAYQQLPFILVEPLVAAGPDAERGVRGCGRRLAVAVAIVRVRRGVKVALAHARSQMLFYVHIKHVWQL